MPRSLQVPVDVAGIYDEQAEELPQALCGDNVRIRLRGVSDEDVSPGFVLTSAVRPIKVSTQFRCDLAIVDSKNIICAGYSCVMHLHTLAEEVTMNVSSRSSYCNPAEQQPNQTWFSRPFFTTTIKRLDESPSGRLSSPRRACVSWPCWRPPHRFVSRPTRTTRCWVGLLFG
jgi:translation elongation factor EF-1alpha